MKKITPADLLADIPSSSHLFPFADTAITSPRALLITPQELSAIVTDVNKHSHVIKTLLANNHIAVMR